MQQKKRQNTPPLIYLYKDLYYYFFLAELTARVISGSASPRTHSAVIFMPTYLIIRWCFKHELCEYLLNYRPKSSCSCLFFNSPLGYLSLCVLCDLKIDVVKLEKLRVLLDKRVLWLCQDPAKCVLVKIVKYGNNGESADKLGDDSELYKILRLYLMQCLVLLSSCLALYLCAETECR